MKKIFSLFIMLLCCILVFAQKQTYDVLTYNLPNGWQQKELIGCKQLIASESKTGEYAIVLLVKATASNASTRESFVNYWNTLVKTAVTVSGEPNMQQPVNDNGWEIISGNAHYTDGADSGTAILLAASDGEHTTAVVLMTNTNKYQNELTALIHSFQLSKTARSETSNTNTGTTNNAVAGLWADYSLERNTTGYLRKEYRFNTNGTYTFRKKNFLTNATEIYFVYETGTYSVSGNQLTITPRQGRTGFWSKPKSLKNNEWGSFAKSVNHKLEKLTYTFEIIEDPNYSNSIILKPGKATVRDGGQFNAPDDPYKFHYSFRKLESLIDNPPGFNK